MQGFPSTLIYSQSQVCLVSSFRTLALCPATMASQDKGRPLPKFGEWDVNNPASAEGFTVIFNKARNEKKTTSGTALNMVSPQSNEPIYNSESYPHSPPRKKRWFCCG